MYVFAGVMFVAPCTAVVAQIDAGEPAECSLPAETKPSFPGGEKACRKYIDEHLVYPEKAKANGVTGRIVMLFTVAEDGSIQDVKVAKRKLSRKTRSGNADAMSGASVQVSPEEAAGRKAVEEECGKLMEEEAVRLICSMPKWEPGTLGGKPVRVKYTLPVKFTL